jgi:hypothetical protein
MVKLSICQCPAITPTQMAEEGAIPRELMAMTGHRSLEEVERHTRAAQKKKQADSAMRSSKDEP